MNNRFLTVLTLLAASTGYMVQPCTARTLLRDICRVKGQEENTIRGLGLVVGLAGTGEANDPQTMRLMARAMEIMHAPLAESPMGGPGGLKDLEKIKNVALVIVTAKVPATGARRGDKLDCRVSAFNGKSLAGGQLAFAALKGPNTNDKTIYGLCEGLIHLDDPAQPLTGVVAGGCQMEADVFTPYMHNGQITLVLDKHHADFQTATDIAVSINRLYAREGDSFVRALDAANIVIQVPKEYQSDPVEFVAAVLNDTEVYSPDPEARVVINQRTGSIVIAGDVSIGDVVVSHKNVLVETDPPSGGVAMIDTDHADTAKLESLVDALNAIKVPAEDRVAIIKEIARSGKLHGKLIVE
jgi:flagellar P-ring protein precursor FlgI